jgi:DNA topoisomerase-1
MNRKYVFKGVNNSQTREIIQYVIDSDVTKKVNSEKYGSNKGKLVPSEVGLLVNQFLTNNFKNIIDYNFTASVENEFDLIASGSKDWKAIIQKFYDPFSLVIDDVQKNAKRETGERILGTDPKTGRQLSVKLGKYGPIAQIGKVDEDEKPIFASLLPDQQISKISQAEALKLFDLPVYVGDFEEEKVEANIGRYGPYIRFQKTFISIPAGYNPFTITIEKSIELIKEKREAERPILVYKDNDVTKGKGRFGPYLKWNGTFINVNKKYDFDNLTESDCIELIEEKIKKDKEKILMNWSSDGISIEKGRWGKIYVIKGKKKIPLAKNVDPLKISLDQAKDFLKIKKK